MAYISEIGAQATLMGKNGVDGVYDADPRKVPDAVKFDTIGYDEVISHTNWRAQIVNQAMVRAQASQAAARSMPCGTPNSWPALRYISSTGMTFETRPKLA